MNLKPETKLTDADIISISGALAAHLTNGLSSIEWLAQTVASTMRPAVTTEFVSNIAMNLCSAELQPGDQSRFQLIIPADGPDLIRMVDRNDRSARENLLLLSEVVRDEVESKPQAGIDLMDTLPVNAGGGAWGPVKYEIRLMVNNLILHPAKPFKGDPYDLALRLEYLDPQRN